MSRVIRLGGVVVPLRRDCGYVGLIRHGKDNRGDATAWIDPPLSITDVHKILELAEGLGELLFSAQTLHSSTQRRCWQTLAHMLVHTGMFDRVPRIQQLEYPTEPLLSEASEKAVDVASDPDSEYYKVLFDEHSRAAVQAKVQTFLNGLRQNAQPGPRNILVVATHGIMAAGLMALLMDRDYCRMSIRECVEHESAFPLGKPSLVLLEIGPEIRPVLWNLQASREGVSWQQTVEAAQQTSAEIQRLLV